MRLLRTGSDAPALGLLLCESRGESIVEYALRDEVPSIEDLQGVIEKLRGEFEDLK